MSCNIYLNLILYSFHCGMWTKTTKDYYTETAGNKVPKTSPGVSLIQAFYFKAMGGFFFSFCYRLTKRDAGAICSSMKDGGLSGGAICFFSPSTAGSHCGHRSLKLIISTYGIVAVYN